MVSNPSVVQLQRPGPDAAVAQLAQQIIDRFGGAQPQSDLQGLVLIEQVLNYAADAEHRIAKMQDRITYLESLSETDELTGLANRRGFERLMSRILASAQRYDETGVLGFLDLDHFKRINDDLGHAAGDKVLQEVGSLLATNSRPSDLVARLGGDEFVVMLVRVDWDSGAERLRKLQQMLNSAIVRFEGRVIRPTVSLGIASFDRETAAADLTHQADIAMYEEKRNSNLAFFRGRPGGDAD